MSFSAEWLALRAGADRRARDAGLAARLARHFAGRRGLRVLDLGAGTGAMMHATAPLLGPGQRWRLTDSDGLLLARAVAPPAVAVEPVATDLAGDLAPLFDPAPQLVTTSAFLDLCGVAWLDRLAARAAAVRATVYAVLSYDGRESWEPAHPLDGAVLAAFHADQRRDKGLGAALGPGAAWHLAAALAGRGYSVETAASDWRLVRPRDAALIDALARGSAAAVRGALGERASEWLRSRTAAAAVTVGHADLLALPPEPAGARAALRRGSGDGGDAGKC